MAEDDILLTAKKLKFKIFGYFTASLLLVDD
jgi:hypothetical protein